MSFLEPSAKPSVTVHVRATHGIRSRPHHFFAGGEPARDRKGGGEKQKGKEEEEEEERERERERESESESE